MSHAISAPIGEQGKQIGDVDEAVAVRVLDAVAADAPCGECSRYCEVGIDVMSFAKNQQSFSNENTSCIHCGICVTVCPMDVLSFDNERQGTVTRKLFGARAGVDITVNGERVV